MTTTADVGLPPVNMVPPEEDGGFSLMFGAMVGIKAAIGDLSAEQAKARDEAKRDALTRLPRDIPVSGGGVVSAAGALAIKCQGPAQGRQWELRRINVGQAAGPATAAGGKADVFAIAGAVTLKNLDNWIGTLTALPGYLTFSARQAVLHGGETLYVVIRTGTSGQNIRVYGTALDYPILPGAQAVIT
jgi:hypothetical protein